MFGSTNYEAKTSNGFRTTLGPEAGDSLLDATNCRRTLPFIGSELTRRNNNNQLNQGLVWIGATLKRGIGPGRRGWFWSNGENIASSQLLWGEGQPNNYNKQQNCIVLDQKLSWMFNDFNCDLDYLPWICQYG